MRTISKTCIEVASVTVPWHQCNQCNIIYIWVYSTYIYITLGSPCSSKSRLLGAVASKLSTISASAQGRRQHQWIWPKFCISVGKLLINHISHIIIYIHIDLHITGYIIYIHITGVILYQLDVLYIYIYNYIYIREGERDLNIPYALHLTGVSYGYCPLTKWDAHPSSESRWHVHMFYMASIQTKASLRHETWYLLRDKFSVLSLLTDHNRMLKRAISWLLTADFQWRPPRFKLFGWKIESSETVGITRPVSKEVRRESIAGHSSP